MQRALITGITGQDGSYLTEQLLEKGYQVHGIIRRSSSFNTERIDHLYQDPEVGERLVLHHGDLSDSLGLNRLLESVKPHEIYNLAAQSHVKVSFDIPDYTARINAMGNLLLLNAMREVGLHQESRFYQASTSELFGKVREIPQNETTPFHPRSPYGIAKLFAHWTTINYRESHGFHASNGILFNHESPRRGETFVTRKITRAAGKIRHGLQTELVLGNLNAQRDWGYAPDYTDMMWRVLQQDEPGDYVCATGKTHSVREFCELAFCEAEIPICFEGEGVEEIGRRLDNGNIVIRVSPDYYRPAEVDQLVGDASKAKLELGWEPQVGFPELVRIMVRSDLALAERELAAG